MEKAKKVCNFYVLTTKLKDVIRKGYINACVSRERMESVAEHVYGTLNLAIGMHYEYKPVNVSLERVLLMLAIHEVEEILVGDIAMSDPNYQEAKAKSREAAIKVLSVLDDSEELIALIDEFDACEELIALIDEFDACETEDAQFAFHCDKLECDLYVKVLSEEESFDIKALSKKDNAFSKRIVTGQETLAEIWLPGDKSRFDDDENFKEVFEYASKNKILDIRKTI